MKAQDIKKDNRFVYEGKTVWTAIADAEVVKLQGFQNLTVVRVIVQFEQDGGREPRYWDVDQEVNGIE